MPRPKTPVPNDDIAVTRLAESWDLSLAAANKSPRTREAYLLSVRLFTDRLATQTHLATVRAVRRADVEGFIADQLTRNKAATAHMRFRCLRTFFNWCLDEEHIDVSPMQRMKAPLVPEEPVPVLTPDEMERILKACSGKSFIQRRNNAIVHLLADTGMRRAELVGLTVSDVEVRDRVAWVMGKGRRPREVRFGDTTAKALDRYLLERSRYAKPNTMALWLGDAGRRFGDEGLKQLMQRLAEKAGVPGLHAHQFRHTFAHSHLANGGQENDLMRLVGWRSREMVGRYAASTADERARANYSSPVDRMKG